MTEVDPACRREAWLNECHAGRTRMGHGLIILLVGVAAVAFSLLFDREEALFLATIYIGYAIVDGPRRLLGGATMYMSGRSAIRALEALGAAPTPARVIHKS